MVRYYQGRRCGTIVRFGNLEACKLRLSSPPNWRQLWDSLIALGVATLPTQSSLPHKYVMTEDGSTMTIAVLAGDHYRQYSYYQPRNYHDPEDSAAIAIRNVVDSAFRQVRPSGNERTFRGRLDLGIATSEFTRCGSRTVWGLHLLVPSGAVPPITTDSSVRISYFVEVGGTLAMPGLRWGEPYSEIVEAATVSIVRPWGEKEC